MILLVLLLLPPRLAAYNVGGVMIHRLFQLPIEHEGKTAGYWPRTKGYAY